MVWYLMVLQETRGGAGAGDSTVPLVKGVTAGVGTIGATFGGPGRAWVFPNGGTGDCIGSTV